MTHQPDKPILRIAVLLPVPVDGLFDYSVPFNMIKPLAGTLVRVPFGARQMIGVVWTASQMPAKPVLAERLKPVINILDFPPLTKDFIAFVDFVARYTLNRPGMILRMVLSSQEAFGPLPTERQIISGKTLPDTLKLTPQRRAVMNLVPHRSDWTATTLSKAAGVSGGVVRGLINAGYLATCSVALDKPFPPPSADHGRPALSPDQIAASDKISQAMQSEKFCPFLLDGVTGSGKTEVYFEAIAFALKTFKDSQILVMLPEIGLTNQWLSRFEDRFGAAPAQWHSDMGKAERRRIWRGVAFGTVRVVVGTRSALFLPFRSLRLLVVDEEHDPSFKQEEGPLYHGRDMAVMRASQASICIVLATATPSLETHVNTLNGRYQRLTLKSRFGTARLPEIIPIDMRVSGVDANHWISAPLRKAMTKTIASGEQVLLFLNRRGYAPLTLCRTCGYRYGCPNCQAWLVEHRFRGELMCHQCGYTMPKPTACFECKAEDSFAACGPGVERLSEEVLSLFPGARVAVLTSDSPGGLKAMRSTVRDLEAGLIDIIIGTQLITKGYHFPNLTLVGVIDADLGLRGGDLRAGERTYQQLMQVSGRAGRAEKKGRVLVQTYEPEHPVIAALISGDRDNFLEAERCDREAGGMPPYGRLAAIIISGDNEKKIFALAKRMAALQPVEESFRVFGPAPAPIARLRGQFRLRFLIQSSKGQILTGYIRKWLSNTHRSLGKEMRKIRLKIDIDPQSFH